MPISSRTIYPYLISFLTLFLFFQSGNNNTIYAQEVTGLAGWNIFLDPGHSQQENQGLYNYSEAEEVLRVGLALREMLLTQTDIDTVFMSRTTDSQLVSLSQRTDYANSLGTDFYYSIHSDAASPDANSALMLYGGWRKDGATIEKTPNGGKKMGDLMNIYFPAAMRISTRGNYADRTFYEGFPDTHAKQYPYLHVNRESNMASVLSEEGFHTNPTQQSKNLNAEWKVLMAQAAFWSIIEYHGLAKPPVGIVTGIITDKETGVPINGAKVTIGDKTYTTDTYESLFNQYSTNPDEIHNGFYYITDLANGTQTVTVEAEGHYTYTKEVNVLTDNFTFADVKMMTSTPPYVVSTSPAEGDTMLNPGTSIAVQFNRDMDAQSVEAAFSINPAVETSLSWINASKLRIRTSEFDFETNYTIYIDSTAKDNSEYHHMFDADGDGVPGGIFELHIKTGPVDIEPPRVISVFPYKVIVEDLRPVLGITFSEELDSASIDSNSIHLLSPNSYSVPGSFAHYVVNEQSVINFFPSEDLDSRTEYTITISGSMKDVPGNLLGPDREAIFNTGEVVINTEKTIDDFDSGVGSWWEPQASGSTTGFITEETSLDVDNTITNLLTGSTQSMKLTYGWNTSDDEFLLREYLAPGTAPQQVRFSNTDVIHAYVFGDGLGNQFRFVVRDANSELEASPWTIVDWIGWKLVSWDLGKDEVIGWVNGNGVLNGQLYVDSFQLTYTPDQPNIGFINIDDFHVTNYTVKTEIEDEFASDLPDGISLDQNYPNPFNPSTNIRFGIPERSEVALDVYDMLGRKVASVFHGIKGAGYHTLRFDASRLASGMYMYRLVLGNESVTKKMILMK